MELYLEFIKTEKKINCSQFIVLISSYNDNGNACIMLANKKHKKKLVFNLLQDLCHCGLLVQSVPMKILLKTRSHRHQNLYFPLIDR